jgi:hypothetical protein
MRQMDLAAVSLRPDKMPSLKPLCQEPKAVLSGPQNLYQVTAPPAKNEDVATQWILRERGLHLRRQSLKSAALMWCTT